MKPKNELIKIYREFETEYIINHIIYAIKSDNKSKIYHLTMTFPPHLFQGKASFGKTGQKRNELIGKLSPHLFASFRTWWVQGLGVYFPNFYRKSKRPFQPVCHAFIDDKTDDEPYPHIHAVCCVPGKLVKGFEKWARRESDLFDRLDIRPADTSDEHLSNIVKYASKYHSKWVLDDHSYRFYCSFPSDY